MLAGTETTGGGGVITGGASPLNNTLVTLSYLTAGSNLKPGQRVMTWGEAGIFPRGVAIGQIVESTRPNELGYFEARVKLAVDAGSLDEVWVKLP
jgi:cell shape-determining protein MreC